MREERQASKLDDLVYMVTGVDDDGDTHIFVTHDLRRAEAKHDAMAATLKDVKANWLDPS